MVDSKEEIFIKFSKKDKKKDDWRSPPSLLQLAAKWAYYLNANTIFNFEKTYRGTIIANVINIVVVR